MIGGNFQIYSSRFWSIGFALILFFTWFMHSQTYGSSSKRMGSQDEAMENTMAVFDHTRIQSTSQNTKANAIQFQFANTSGKMVQFKPTNDWYVCERRMFSQCEHVGLIDHPIVSTGQMVYRGDLLGWVDSSTAMQNVARDEMHFEDAE